MQMGIVHQGLPPRMQDGKEPDLGAQMGRVGRDRPERIGGGAEQDAIDDGFVLQRDRGDRVGHGEHHVEVVTVENLRLALFDPRGARQRLAGRAMSIATTVVPDACMPTAVTLLDMAAQRGGSTAFDRRHDAPLGRQKRGPRLGPIGFAVAAEHVRHGVCRPIHAQGVRRSAEVAGKARDAVAAYEVCVCGERFRTCMSSSMRCRQGCHETLLCEGLGSPW